MTEPIDCYDLVVDDDFFFNFEGPDLSDLPPAEAFCSPSSDSVSSWIGQIESLLMNDDDQEQHIALESDQQPISDFLADILVDSPVDDDGSGEVGADKESDVSDDSGDPSHVKENAGGLVEKESDASDDSGVGSPEKESADRAELNIDGEDPDDPIAKKRRRQLRNKDAAVRSRERKKSYLKDVEMKSKYLERECMRLGRLLQCFVAENQALRLSLQKGGNAYGASMAKQESAVLLWESLLLGSLLWFLGIMCLLPQPPVESIPLETVVRNDRESVAPSGRGSKTWPSLVGEPFVKSRRCKASRTKMKSNSTGLATLA